MKNTIWEILGNLFVALGGVIFGEILLRAVEATTGVQLPGIVSWVFPIFCGFMALSLVSK